MEKTTKTELEQQQEEIRAQFEQLMSRLEHKLPTRETVEFIRLCENGVYFDIPLKKIECPADVGTDADGCALSYDDAYQMIGKTFPATEGKAELGAAAYDAILERYKNSVWGAVNLETLMATAYQLGVMAGKRAGRSRHH